MTQAFLPLGHDYAVLSLSALRAPVIERRVIDIRVVEGLQGLLVEEEEVATAVMSQLDEIGGVVVEEEAMSAAVEVEDIAATMSGVEDLTGVFGDGDL